MNILIGNKNMNEYENLKDFWNKCFEAKESEIEAVNDKWVEDETFNTALKKYAKDKENVLDLGSGSGWGLIEAYYTVKFNKGIGIDQSANGVNYSNAICKKSNLNNLEFIQGDENVLDNYKEYFDFVMSVNLFDVIPDDVIRSILNKLKPSLKKDAYLMICLNPDFTEDQMINMLKMEHVGNHYYKNGVMRCNDKTKDEWIELFSEYFDFIEFKNFILVDREKDFPRKMFILKNK